MTFLHSLPAAAVAAVFLAGAAPALADAVVDWNATAGDLVAQAKIGTPPAIRVMAIVQTAVHEAVVAARVIAPGDAVVVATDAAVAAAHYVTIGRLLPQVEKGVDAAYREALAKLADGPAKRVGIAAGEQAAARVLAWRADDGAAAPDRYRPHAAPGAYVPTASPAATQWSARRPWLLADAAQYRPGPPPALGSVQWARDYNEVRQVGAKSAVHRTAEQTDAARFWEFSLPSIYHEVARSVARQPGRTIDENARLFAAVGQAMDDAVIAVMEAKYHYGFWRPVTAIRNGDRDANPATERDAAWSPLLDNPMHPEYPSAHGILAATLGELLRNEIEADKAHGREPAAPVAPVLATRSPTAGGTMRRWYSVDALVDEVANSRIWAGIHYRTSTDAGVAMGRQIGALATGRIARAPLGSGVPQVLVPRSEGKLVDALVARGVQIYACRADAATPAGARWTFVGPRADLFDASGKPAGRHDRGPQWMAGDGSRLLGAVQASADAPQADAIPWLLLSARSVGGEGRFARVTSIQRINTTGGAEPVDACHAGTIGERARVPYTADYLFYAS